MSDFWVKAILKEDRGWTEAGIKRFLGKPDKTATNPHYKCASAMCLYKKERVKQVESTADFKAWQERSVKRRKAALDAAETKKRNLLNTVQSWSIDVPVLPMNEVRRLAVDHYNNWEGNYEVASLKDSEADFLNRITVNYIRHQLTIYDDSNRWMSGKVGKDEAYYTNRHRVFDAIAHSYPKLSKECKLQDQLS